MIDVRHALPSDLPKLTEIYNYYVGHSNSTFDTKAHSLEQRALWFERYKTIGPHRLLVAIEEKEVVGFACTSRYREHEAFEQTAEVSVYVSPGHRTKGIGTLLYQRLFDEIRDENIHLLVAGVALPNEASINLHKKFGFTEVGVFREYAVKK